MRGKVRRSAPGYIFDMPEKVLGRLRIQLLDGAAGIDLKPAGPGRRATSS
jgi:hypothetical protein